MTDTPDFDIESTLAQLADMDVSGIAEIRSERFVQGTFGWRVAEAEGPVRGKPTDDGTPRALCKFVLECIEVVSLLKPSEVANPESLIGKKHTETQFIELGAEYESGVGRTRAFIADIGCNNKGKLGEIVAATVGHVFRAPIVHSANKQDPSNPYARLRLQASKTGTATTANV